MNIHPKWAGGIFAFLYGIIGLIISALFKVEVFDHVWFYIIGLILDSIIYKIFADRYDGIE